MSEILEAIAKEIAVLKARVSLLERQEHTAANAIDHGGLVGLADDDHPQYFALAQDEVVTGRPAFNGGETGVSTPFTVDSEDCIEHLNADMVDDFHANPNPTPSTILPLDANGQFPASVLGGDPYRIVFVAAKNLVDNTATSVIRITTTNEAGSADGGGYTVLVHVLAQAGAKTQADSAARGQLAHFSRAINAAGDRRGLSAVATISTTASADTAAAARSIGTLTVTVVEVDAYNVDIQVLIDHTGTGTTGTIYAIVEIDVLWFAFNTAPTVAAV
jgi:hypothetical protein